jgi:hypothetical protein
MEVEKDLQDLVKKDLQDLVEKDVDDWQKLVEDTLAEVEKDLKD